MYEYYFLYGNNTELVVAADNYKEACKAIKEDFPTFSKNNIRAWWKEKI